MSSTLDDQALTELLPGAWAVAATNFPMWISGDRSDPRFVYDLVSTDPLVLADDVEYTDSDGQRKHILGRDTRRGLDFVWRGKGLLRLVTSRWSVEGVSDDGSVLAIRFAKSLVTPSGVDILVREGAQHPELRAMIARDTARFGLSPEDFGSLSWLAAAPSR